MVVEVKEKNGIRTKYHQVVCVCILETHKDHLYILQRKKELLIPLKDIVGFKVREPIG